MACLNELRLILRPPPRCQQSVDAVTRVPENLIHSPVPQPGEQHVSDRLLHVGLRRHLRRSLARVHTPRSI